MRAAILFLAILLAGCDFGMKARRDAEQARALQQALQAETERQRVESEIARSKWQARAEFDIVAWNIESGGNDPATIAERLARLGGDIVALSEVQPTEFARFAMGRPEIHTESGSSDRLQITWAADRFELVRRIELSDLNEGNHRAPLVAHFRKLPDGPEFMVVNNHLARGNESVRLMQAEGLVAWAREQSLPIIAVGDYNFDFDFAADTGNDAFKAFMRDGIWSWARPAELVDTNWSDRNEDGVDDFPGSMLDFAFTAGPATLWTVEAAAVVEAGDFPDDARTSDHRPIRVRILPARVEWR